MVAAADLWLAEGTVIPPRRMQLSHETIYRSLFIQARGVLKKELHGESAHRAALCGAASH